MKVNLLKSMVVFGLVGLFVGCASGPSGDRREYQPASGEEQLAFNRSDLFLSLGAVKTNLDIHLLTDVAWVGIIKDVQFKETRTSIQVAFYVEEHGFDWMDHGGELGRFHLDAKSDGNFTAGWEIPRPALISHLQKQARVGDMLVVYGQPRAVREDGSVHVKTSFVHPVPQDQIQFVGEGVEP